MMKKETATRTVDTILRSHMRALDGTKTVDEVRARTTEAFQNVATDFKNIISEIYRDHANEMRTVLTEHEGN